MTEIPVSFGRDRHLIGTVTLPAVAGAPADGGALAERVGFIIINAGVIHRVGPHRWHVKLARHMAAQGCPAIRFDPSGLGDSRVPRAAASFKEQAVLDVREAMDQLAALSGVNRFIVGGICSGAENGFNTALADPRVIGLWMLDGFAFPTARTRWRRYTLKMRSMSIGEIIRSGARKMRGRGTSNAAMGDAAGAETAAVGMSKVGDAPPPGPFAKSLQTLVDRGVSVYFIYSGSIIHLYNYSEQLHDAFAGQRFLQALRCDYRPDIDHTVTTLACQSRLTDLLAAWSRTVHPPNGQSLRDAV